MRILSRYMGIIILILIFVVLTSGCVSEFMAGLNKGITDGLNSNSSYTTNDTSFSLISNTPTKTYSAYDVSFKYPCNWHLSADNATGNNMIFVTKDISFNNVQFQVEILPNNGMSEQGVITEMQSSMTPGWNKNASYKITVNGKNAYEDVYVVNDSHYSKLMRVAQIYFIQNDKTYLMLLQAPNSEFNKEKSYFGVILNSFKVQ
ncbi:PsbP-related protein [Methanobacterium sp.]|uniref:PsbP-related protein n=1 Tax=Methanobacterium sp. TaxID=2164 RepID=UPI003C76A9FB